MPRSAPSPPAGPGTAAPRAAVAEPAPTANRDLLARLRQSIRAIERKAATLESGENRRPFGIACVDAALGGGLPVAALHEIAAPHEPALAAATGFALALAAGAARPILWIAEDRSARESGHPYGPGLAMLGLAPEAIVTVAAAQARDVLWAMEEGLRCRALGAVIGEIHAAPAIDGVAIRRLSLAAGAHATPALLLRPASRQNVVAETRWLVSPAAETAAGPGVGRPAFRAQLVRNRHGRLGCWTLEWDCVERRFHLAATEAARAAHPVPVAAAPADRPPRPAVA